jgi:hypothetical protein
MDTNIIMNNPDHNDWSVKADGQNLFVLSDTLIQELEFIRRKEGTKEKIESRDKAEMAIKSLASLFRQGDITEGITVKYGWVIGVASPKKATLDPELEQLEDIVKAFKRSDTKLLLLTKECHQLFESTPVTLVTGEWNLFNAVQLQGVPCHLCTGFPIEGLKEAAAITKEVDWDEVLREVASNTKERAIAVEATLTARKSPPSWLATGSGSFMVAEGHGVMRAGNEVRPFLWTIPYYPQTIEPRLSDDDESPTDLPSVHLDFFGEDDFGQDLFDAIADRLSDCRSLTFEEGSPTLQSPQSIMQILLYFEYLDRKGFSDKALDNLRQEVRESEGLTNCWTDWILGTEDEDERYACLEGFILALNNCWEIGQTYTFSIIIGQQ